MLYQDQILDSEGASGPEVLYDAYHPEHPENNLINIQDHNASPHIVAEDQDQHQDEEQGGPPVLQN